MKFHLSDEEALKQLKHTSDNIKFDDLTIEERSIHYAYIETKKEFLTLFVHGSPGSFSTFIDFFQSDSLLKKTDIVSVDRPGFGQSNFGIAETSIKRQAALIHEVAQLFPHKKKILVGHSLGGPVIARMTMDHPKSYDGLLYIAPSIDPNLEKKEWYRSIIDTQIGRLLTPIELK